MFIIENFLRYYLLHYRFIDNLFIKFIIFNIHIHIYIYAFLLLIAKDNELKNVSKM